VASRILFANPEYCNREEVAAGLRNKIPADRQNKAHYGASGTEFGVDRRIDPMPFDL
jgi:hypothetical protein